MMLARYSAAASLDLEGIYSTIAADNQPAAVRVIASIKHLVHLVAEYPGMGKSTEMPDVQKIIVPGFPYKIIYELDSRLGELVILRIYHSARNLSH